MLEIVSSKEEGKIKENFIEKSVVLPVQTKGLLKMPPANHSRITLQ